MRTAYILTFSLAALMVYAVAPDATAAGPENPSASRSAMSIQALHIGVKIQNKPNLIQLKWNKTPHLIVLT